MALAVEFDQSMITIAEQLADKFAQARQQIHKVIFGQETVVDQTLITILAGGHGLLVGVPGLAKTRLVQLLGHSLGLHAKRVQFTPDLMPADILGSEILDESETGRRHFRFIEGPIFCQLLMADEINRASPRTQSALLQAMQENHISIAGFARDLPRPFHVLATQNPIEQEGTYPLPEAQLDRFLLQIDVSYPTRAAERAMLLATTGVEEEWPAANLSANDLITAQKLIRRLPIGDSIVDSALDLVRKGRTEGGDPQLTKHLAWGPGPRASQALILASRARALLDNRTAPDLDDLRFLAKPVLRHRLALNYAAQAEGVTIDGLIDQLADRYLP